ncbi:hypothetical protein CN135_23900 [Sinorhizobium meliloti]|nr:hypothetical protein [Sinorhizobium meliloti]MDX0359621.1 hypothetical protein [Sinorhizobium meliloti]RVG40954.1 hypothetical protein CN226_36415 [Sinorhizobium meliloti]RVL75979.1 hypothetical protein CN135_23900 [Sinorhizobium meliloti]WGI76295.1 hypothetical protein QC756_19025 [Sinorhizobium meliloti]
MRPIAVSVLLNLALMTSANAGDDISIVWRELFERCRVAVETGKEFDATGLRDLGRSVRAVPPLTAPGLPKPLMRGYQMAEQRWGIPGDRFVVVEAEYPPHRGKSRRSCDVELAPAAEPISTAEENLLKATFLAERDELLRGGHHEHWGPEPIFSTNLGIRLVRRNPHGCRVVSGLYIETRPGRGRQFFRTLSGEQAGDCGGAPRLLHSQKPKSD